MQKILEGIRAVEWAIAWAGPAAGYVLTDLGAEVIRIEDPVNPERSRTQGSQARQMGVQVGLPGGTSPGVELCHRGKKSIMVDMRKEKGLQIVYDLIKTSDVFYNNFRKSVRAKRGLDYETLSNINPRLIYATTSAYGERGPEKELRGFDTLGMAKSGFMWSSGEPDMPPQQRVFGVCDQMTATTLANGIIAALLARERFGIGQELYVSLYGTMMHAQAPSIQTACLTEQEVPRPWPRAEAFNFGVNYYECKDGEWVLFALNQPQEVWHDFCEALGIQHLENDPRFEKTKSRGENCKELIHILDEVFATKPRGEWLKILWAKELVVAPVNRYLDLVNDEQTIANEYIVEFDHPELGRTKHMGYPVSFSKTPAQIKAPAPQLGQHTEEVLKDLCGYSSDKVAELKGEGVVA